MYTLFYCAFFGLGTKTSLALLNETPKVCVKVGYYHQSYLWSIWMSCSSTCLLSILIVMLAIITLAPYVMLMILPFLLHHPLLSEFFSELFATDHNLIFNAAKTQLICFRSPRKIKCTGKFFFSGHLLKFSDTVTHLGHVLHCSLDDSEDIKRATLEMCKKPIILSTFSSCDPQVKTVLFNSHCLSLYGGALWNITCRQLTSLKVAFNNILR